MDKLISDAEFLRNYYSTIYESQEYNDYIKSEKKFSNASSNSYRKYEQTVFIVLLLLASIYSSLFIFLKFNIFYIFFSIPLILLILFANNKEHNRLSKIEDSLLEENKKCKKAFDDLLNRTEKPAIPNDKLTPEFIKVLLEVFDSGRADTFKEALVIYEQDCQHRELVAYQNSLIAAANAARNAAEEANARAAKAKKEADYQRREAEYWRQEEWYRRNR